MYSILSNYHMYHMYIYIYKSTSTKPQQLTHIRNVGTPLHSYCDYEPHVARPVHPVPPVNGFSGGGRALLPRPSSGTARDLPKKPQGVQQWTRFFFLMDIPCSHPCMNIYNTFTIGKYMEAGLEAMGFEELVACVLSIGINTWTPSVLDLHTKLR